MAEVSRERLGEIQRAIFQVQTRGRSQLMPGVKIGQHSIVGPGTLVLNDVTVGKYAFKVS